MATDGGLGFSDEALVGESDVSKEELPVLETKFSMFKIVCDILFTSSSLQCAATSEERIK